MAKPRPYARPTPSRFLAPHEGSRSHPFLEGLRSVFSAIQRKAQGEVRSFPNPQRPLSFTGSLPQRVRFLPRKGARKRGAGREDRPPNPDALKGGELGPSHTDRSGRMRAGPAPAHSRRLPVFASFFEPSGEVCRVVRRSEGERIPTLSSGPCPTVGVGAHGTEPRVPNFLYSRP